MITATALMLTLYAWTKKKCSLPSCTYKTPVFCVVGVRAAPVWDSNLQEFVGE